MKRILIISIILLAGFSQAHAASVSHSCVNSSQGEACDAGTYMMPDSTVCISSSTVDGWNTQCNAVEKAVGGTTYSKVINCNQTDGVFASTTADCLWQSSAISKCNSLNRVTAHSSDANICGACKTGYSFMGVSPENVNTDSCFSDMEPNTAINRSMAIKMLEKLSVPIIDITSEIAAYFSGSKSLQDAITVIEQLIDTNLAALGGGKWEDGAEAGEIYYNGGNVGIGTDDPQAELDVNGDIKISGGQLIFGDMAGCNRLGINTSGGLVCNEL